MTSSATPTARSRAAPPSRRAARTSERKPAPSPIAVAMAVSSLGFLVAGIIWPQAADALLRMLLATLAVGFVTALAHRAIRPMSATHDVPSPFGRVAAPRAPAVAPQALRKFTTELSAAEAARSARRNTIPLLARLTVRGEATRRLAQHHGLSLDESAHHPRIRSLVSEPTWQLIRPGDARTRSARDRTARGQSVPLNELGRILDDLEAF